MKTKKKVLILGATGGIGGEVARRLLASGWEVHAMHRSETAPASTSEAIHWSRGDAMNRDDVVRAAQGAAVIVHAVNPAGYRDWDKVVLPMIDNTIAAAIANRARIVLPGTVYNYGPSAFPTLREDSPQQPVTRKGAIRVALEQRLRDATMHGARALIVRAGDFFGPQAGNNWFSQGLVTPGQPVTTIRYPGRVGTGHQWAYLPDVAEAMARLLEREDALPDFDTFHLDGHWDADGTQMVAAIARASGQPGKRASSFRWPLLLLASPFVPVLREMAEMRYLWQQPLRMSNAKLLALLGDEPRTPLDVAVRETLVGLKCLPDNE